VFKWLNEWIITELTRDSLITSDIPLHDFDRILYEIRLCDVILIEGRNRVSDVIKTITQSPWSHAALYIGRLHDIENPKLRNLVSILFQGPPDTPLVIESILGKGTIISPLVNYAKDNIRICRPKGLSRQDAQHIIAYAINKLGNQYDVRHVIDLARFLLPWSFIPRRFRSTLFQEYAGQSIKAVCSSMIAEAFESVQFPILPLARQTEDKSVELYHRNPKLFTPRDFDYSPYFEIIKYPYLEIGENPVYRNLPWNKDGRLVSTKPGINSVYQATDFEMDSPPKKEEPKKPLKPPRILPKLKQLNNPFRKKKPKPESLGENDPQL
jgi:hypothetical protein